MADLCPLCDGPCQGHQSSPTPQEDFVACRYCGSVWWELVDITNDGPQPPRFCFDRQTRDIVAWTGAPVCVDCSLGDSRG